MGHIIWEEILHDVSNVFIYLTISSNSHSML